MTSQKPATTTKKTNNTLSSSQTTSHNHHTPTTEAQQPQRPTQHYTPPPKHTNHQHNTTKQPTTKQNKTAVIVDTQNIEYSIAATRSHISSSGLKRYLFNWRNFGCVKEKQLIITSRALHTTNGRTSLIPYKAVEPIGAIA